MADFILAIQQTCGNDLSSMRKADRLQLPTAGPWKLIYYEAYLNQHDALGREKYLKSGAGRRFLKAQLRNYFAEMTVNSTA